MSRWNWRSIAAISGSVAAMWAVWDAFAAVAAIGVAVDWATRRRRQLVRN
jgi:hypothetical protein